MTDVSPRRSRSSGRSGALDSPTRKRIIEAAVELFGTEGFGQSSLRDIAELANVNVASIYHYFESKQDILVEIIETTFEGNYRPALAAVEEAPGPAHALVALTRHHIAFHCTRAAEATISDRELGVLKPKVRMRVVELRDAYEGLWDDVLRTGADEGLFTVEDRELVRMAALTMCSQVAGWYRPEGRLTVTAVADLYSRLVLRLVGFRRPPSTAAH